jgi:cytochrome P450
VSRHADVRAWLRDHEHLSNAGNFRLDEDVAFPPAMVMLDPPDHSRLRRLVVGAFSSGVVAAAEPFIRKHALALIDGFAPDGEADLVAALARPLPAAVIAYMVGVPGEDVETFMGWTHEVTARIPVAGDAPALHALFDYTHELIDRRRALHHPPDDLVTRLIQAEVDGERLSDAEIVGTIAQLILAGQDTVTRLIGNCLHELLRDRRHWERLLADRSLVPAAIDESLRHDAPLQWAMRVCKQATEIGGVAVRPGTRVLLGIGSANRDELLWRDPDGFSLDRETAPAHLAFGHGIHLCLGASLGRAEGRIALEALLDRLPGLRLAAGFTYEITETAMARGPQRLDVVWRP